MNIPEKEAPAHRWIILIRALLLLARKNLITRSTGTYFVGGIGERDAACFAGKTRSAEVLGILKAGGPTKSVRTSLP